MSFAGALRFVVKSVISKPRMLEPGDPAPDFDKTDQAGRPVRLHDLRGHKVVLWFYPKADTSG